MVRRPFLSFAVLPLWLFVGCATEVEEAELPGWALPLERQLSALGYQNWIILAEASYPVVSKRGFRTVVVDAEVPEVLEYLVGYFERSENLKPSYSTARELPYVSNHSAPGIAAFRGKLKSAFKGTEVREADHRSLGLMADRQSQDFSVLVIKTKTSLPYSNVFIELDSAYWDSEFEDELRSEMRGSTTPQELSNE